MSKSNEQHKNDWEKEMDKASKHKRVQEDQQEDLINARSALAADRRVKYRKNKTMLGEV